MRMRKRERTWNVRYATACCVWSRRSADGSHIYRYSGISISRISTLGVSTCEWCGGGCNCCASMTKQAARGTCARRIGTCKRKRKCKTRKPDDVKRS